MHFFLSKNSNKNKTKKVKAQKMPVQCLESRKRMEIPKNPKILILGRYFLVFCKECFFILNCIEKKSCCKVDAIFKVVKVNFGSKLGPWVSFLTAILQS